jgi:hypothetical protein
MSERRDRAVRQGLTEYRKTATVFAYRVESGEQPISVYSLEGPGIARPGDYIVTANTEPGESWIVAGSVFEATYEPVQS